MGGPDQREHERVEASFRVRATAIDPNALPGDNVSRGGIFVKTVRFLPLNAVIRLSIEMADGKESIPATCRVVFIRDQAEAAKGSKPAGMGLEILDMADVHRPMLERLLQDRRATAPPPPAPARVEGRLRIVVVDDDSRYKNQAAEPFVRRGDIVHTTSDGLEALAICLKDPPDIILSDVQMPRMDGWQLLRLVRARPSLAAVPVVFLTSLGGEAERLLGYQLGVDAYIPKPYEPEELLVRVHQIVRRARNARTSPAARTTLRGEIEHVAISSVLTFLELERRSGILLVIGDEVARLFFSEGRLLRAELEGVEPAPRPVEIVKRVLDFTSGQFEFAAQDVNVADEVGVTVTAILLEHARDADERKK